MNFLFMDESISDDTNVASLTAMFVPSTKYRVLRNKFYEGLNWAVRPEPNNINLDPPELHGCKLLPDIDDDGIRLKTVSRVVDLVVENDIDIFRVGYRLTKSFRESFKPQHAWTGLCWLGIQAVTQRLFENELIVPVMDSCSMHHVQGISGQVRTADIMRSVGLESSLSINNTDNLGEVLYAHSNFSSLTQVVDIVSYLRHVADWAEGGLEMTDFKRSLDNISERLVPQLRYENVIEMKTAT